MSFLSGLPSFHAENFSQTHKKTIKSSTSTAPAPYIPTHNTAPPENQVITTEKTHPLLRTLSKENVKSPGGVKRKSFSPSETRGKKRKADPKGKTKKGSDDEENEDEGEDKGDEDEENEKEEEEEEEEEKEVVGGKRKAAGNKQKEEKSKSGKQPKKRNKTGG